MPPATVCVNLVQTLSLLAPCFPILSPVTYYSACKQATCLGGEASAEAVVQQYVTDCRARNSTIVSPPVDVCGILLGDGSSCVDDFATGSVVDTTHFTTIDGLTYNFAGVVWPL